MRSNAPKRSERDEDDRKKRQKDCFAAGTLIWCATGLRPIESIRWGDQVLSQDPETGELAYKLVLGTSTRPPEELVSLTINDVTILTTRGHRFWVPGTSWTMAKHLKAEDRLQTLRGSSRIDQVGLAAPVVRYNLLVEDFNTYFVGQQALLVHDNGIPHPTNATIPGRLSPATSR